MSSSSSSPDSKSPTPESPNSSSSSLLLMVKSEDGREFFFTVNKTSPFSSLLTEYCQAAGIDNEMKRHIKFSFDGEKLGSEETPLDFDLMEGDQLDAIYCFEDGSHVGVSSSSSSSFAVPSPPISSLSSSSLSSSLSTTSPLPEKNKNETKVNPSVKLPSYSFTESESDSTHDIQSSPMTFTISCPPSSSPSTSSSSPSPPPLVTSNSYFPSQPSPPSPPSSIPSISSIPSSSSSSSSRRSIISSAPLISPSSLSIPIPPPSRPISSHKSIRVYYCEEMKGIAHQIKSLFPDRIQLCSVQWNHFADGFPDLFIEKSSEIKWYHTVFLSSFHSPSVIFEQFAVASALPKALPKSYKLILPFFPTGTMERVSVAGEVATANTLARVLSAIPQCAKGPAQICIFDIHALQNQFYFKDTVLIRLSTCIPLLISKLQLLESSSPDPICIAFPDDGAHKRFHDFFSSHYDVVICHKVRDGDKRVVKMKEGDVREKHVVIVDDLVQSGGTLLECGKELRRNGAKGVSAYVTHAVFPKEAWKKFVVKEKEKEKGEEKDKDKDKGEQGDEFQFRHFWVTDTNPRVTDTLMGKKPFEVLNIAPLIAEYVLDEVV